MTSTATVSWAQRAEWVYVKVELSDVTKEKIDVSPDGMFSFTGTSGGKQFTSQLQLFGEVDVEVHATRHCGAPRTTR